MVLSLVTNGHIYAYSYGYSYLKTAIKSVLDKEKHMVIAMAAAIGLAFCGDENKWRQFNDSGS